MRKSRYIVVLLVIVLALVLSVTAAAQERVEIRWFVGLGAGTDAPQIATQQAIVDEFNASQSQIELVLEIADSDLAYDILSNQIESGNPPDIVGPVGTRGRSFFAGEWLDLTSLIQANNYDLSDFDPSQVESYNIEGEGQIGIPFAVFPSFLMYNVDLFDAAGIPYPPRNYGDSYIDWNGNAREWNMDTLRDVAMMMTFDSAGNNATTMAFNPNDIVQFGYGNQWTDLRGRLTLFGAGSFMDENGNAQIPQQWRDGLEWYQQAMWEDFFYPNSLYANTEMMGYSNWFESGNIAMITTHVWYLSCCTWGLDGVDYQLAPVPSYNGISTAKLQADTFSILNSTQHPQEAFTVLTYLLGEKADELAALYGGIPARLSLQGNAFASLSQNPPIAGHALYWDIVINGLDYVDMPSHESPLPNLSEAEAVYTSWSDQLEGNPNFDLQAEPVALINQLQAVFNAAR